MGAINPEGLNIKFRFLSIEHISEQNIELEDIKVFKNNTNKSEIKCIVNNQKISIILAKQTIPYQYTVKMIYFSNYTDTFQMMALNLVR